MATKQRGRFGDSITGRLVLSNVIRSMRDCAYLARACREVLAAGKLSCVDISGRFIGNRPTWTELRAHHVGCLMALAGIARDIRYQARLAAS